MNNIFKMLRYLLDIKQYYHYFLFIFNSQDIEFTIQDGRLYILECSCAKRTAKAAARICVEMVKEGIITERESLLRFEPDKIAYFEQNNILDAASIEEASSRCMFSADNMVGNLGTATTVGIGVATGKIVFTSQQYLDVTKNGDKAILVVDELIGSNMQTIIQNADAGNQECSIGELEFGGLINKCEGVIILHGSIHSAGSRAARRKKHVSIL